MRKVYKGYSFRKYSQWKIVETSNNVKLLSSVSLHPESKGYILFIHGWEGGIESGYIIRSANFFWNHGYSIIRINLRDHGETHHLNEGLFNGSLLEETYEAIHIISKTLKNKPLYIIGFSLGGNFALRIAEKHSKTRKKVKLLEQIFSICPALDPYEATLLLDKSLIFRKYFLKAWKDSLIKKQKLFPYLYDFKDLLNSRSVMELTEKMIPRFSPFTNIHEYFSTYTLKKTFFAKIKIKTTIFASKDDPVIPYQHFLEIENNENVLISLQENGGHCGFILNLKDDTWYSNEILQRIQKNLLNEIGK
ncbi:MAG: alpha/beta fold hydrolase [Leptospiraceae bacterium]|nr:alpha/beta fold hydrolase [Leptospiraceae bacterium]